MEGKIVLIFLSLVGISFAAVTPLWLVETSCGVWDTVRPAAWIFYEATAANHQLDNPIIAFTKIDCSPYQTDNGNYYHWVNQTDENTITSWQCYDPQCQSCSAVQKNPSGPKNLFQNCSADYKPRLYLFNDFPGAGNFYKKSIDPNKNWFIGFIPDTCMVKDTQGGYYFPYNWIHYWDYAGKRSCAIRRCTSKAESVEYQYTTTPDGDCIGATKVGKLDFPQGCFDREFGEYCLQL